MTGANNGWKRSQRGEMSSPWMINFLNGMHGIRWLFVRECASSHIECFCIICISRNVGSLAHIIGRNMRSTRKIRIVRGFPLERFAINPFIVTCLRNFCIIIALISTLFTLWVVWTGGRLKDTHIFGLPSTPSVKWYWVRWSSGNSHVISFIVVLSACTVCCARNSCIHDNGMIHLPRIFRTCPPLSTLLYLLRSFMVILKPAHGARWCLAIEGGQIITYR